jgi:hypothetical protein
MGPASYTNAVFNEDPCGSGLARDEAGTSCIDVDWQTAIAGKPAPTGISVVS